MKRKSLNKKIIKYLYHIFPYTAIIKVRLVGGVEKWEDRKW